MELKLPEFNLFGRRRWYLFKRAIGFEFRLRYVKSVYASKREVEKMGYIYSATRQVEFEV